MPLIRRVIIATLSQNDLTKTALAAEFAKFLRVHVDFFYRLNLLPPYLLLLHGDNEVNILA